MTTTGWILGTLIVLNIVLGAATKNFAACAGWGVAFLEWLRRFGIN